MEDTKEQPPVMLTAEEIQAELAGLTVMRDIAKDAEDSFDRARMALTAKLDKQVVAETQALGFVPGRIIYLIEEKVYARILNVKGRVYVLNPYNRRDAVRLESATPVASVRYVRLKADGTARKRREGREFVDDISVLAVAPEDSDSIAHLWKVVQFAPEPDVQELTNKAADAEKKALLKKLSKLSAEELKALAK